MMINTQITIIPEFFHTGHNPEYLNHILTFLDKNQYSETIMFYLSPYLKEHIKISEKSKLYNHIHFFEKTDIDQLLSLKDSKQIASQIFSLIRKIKINFDHLIFLNINFVLRAKQILLPFYTLNYTFSGIYFHSPYRLRQNSKIKKLSIFKREFALRLLSLNKRCTSVHLLNDKEGAKYYRNRFSKKIHFIHDPIRLNPASNLNIREYHNISGEKIIALHIGALGMYKGTPDVLKIPSSISSETKQKSHFLIVGRISDDLKKLISANNISNKNISIRDKFVSNDDFTAYFEQCDLVLIANRNIEASSGIVNHCLAKKKVVVAPKLGYFLESLSNYKGAILFDKDLPFESAVEKAINEIKEFKDSAESFDVASYINNNSGDSFSNQILLHKR